MGLCKYFSHMTSLYNLSSADHLKIGKFNPIGRFIIAWIVAIERAYL